MLATISNLSGLVTAARRYAIEMAKISETDLYTRAGVTKAQADALYASLAAIDHATLIRLMNVTRGTIGVTQYNGFDTGSASAAPGNRDGDITVTHNASISSLLGDLAA